MKFKLKPFSRLTIIFILAVTIPGSILSYLSIQNITNLQELTERRVLEEEERIAELVYLRFRKKLSEITSKYSGSILKIDENKHASIRYADTLEYVENPFIMDLNGAFLWPSLHDQIITPNRRFSDAYNSNFASAERFEFILKNYTSAASRYQSALPYAIDKADSAQVINAIARVYFKSGLVENALNYYTMLVDRYGNVYDRNGLPFLMYAVPQILKLSDSSNASLVFSRLKFVTSEIVSGNIALNQTTSVLIDDISSWIIDHTEITADEKDEVDKDLREIRKRISFLQANDVLLKDYVLVGRNVESISLEENIHAIKGRSEITNESIIVFESDQELIFGFTVNLDSLAGYVARVELPSGYRFAYTIEITTGNNEPVSPDLGLVTVANLSPLTPEKSIQVKLKDEYSLKKQIYRNSWIYGVAIVLLIGGMILGVFLIIKDIHRERRLSKLRSEFVSNVTHELKTPLTSIHMFAESILLDRVKTTSDRKEYLGIILKETDRLKRLINNILDFSKREQGKLVYHFNEVNISELVNSAVSDLDYWIAEKQFKVSTEISEDIMAFADPDALKQAVINLMSNAIKYSPQRKEIMIRVWKDEELVYIEVEDKGIGIAEDKLEQIFNKFYRIENTGLPDSTGTGLGLTVVKDIAEAHHARILVKSKIGQGSAFTIILNTETHEQSG